MLAPAHYAAGLATGTLAWKLSGSPSVGIATAAASHIALDTIFDEFWEWKDMGDYAVMGMMLFPLVLIAGATSYGYFKWAGWWPVIFGASGIAPDVIDFIVKQITAKLGLYVKRYLKKLYGWEIFPCHYQSPLYWGQLNGMLSFNETASLEWILGLAGVLATYLVLKVL